MSVLDARHLLEAKARNEEQMVHTYYLDTLCLVQPLGALVIFPGYHPPSRSLRDLDKMVARLAMLLLLLSIGSIQSDTSGAYGSSGIVGHAVVSLVAITSKRCWCALVSQTSFATNLLPA